MRQVHGLVASLACLAITFACGGSEDKNQGAGDPDGGGQTGGSSANGSGGADASTGTGGTVTGTGGTSTGTGGTVAGTGGTNDAGPGSGGSATGGNDGGNTLSAGRCDEQCGTASDCGVGYDCTDNHCECISGQLCTANLFGFHSPGCTTDDDCDGLERCVEWAGSTYCTEVDGDLFALCLSPQGYKLSLQLADSPDGSDGTVVICHGGAPIRCASDTKLCERGCADDGDCAFQMPGMRTCHLDTGRCGCTDDENGDTCDPDLTDFQCKANRECGCAADGRCEYSDDGPHCDVATGECGCQTHEDCAESYNGAYCLNGKCGCTGSGECRNSPQLSGTSMVCAPE